MPNHDEDVMEVFASQNVSGYTKWDRVLGKGRMSEPKLDDDVWPGYNCAIAMAVENGDEEKIFAALRQLYDHLGGKGFVVFELPILRVM